jgi:hypothetical protein
LERRHIVRLAASDSNLEPENVMRNGQTHRPTAMDGRIIDKNAQAARVFQKSLKNVVTPANSVHAGDAAVMPRATPKSQDSERFGVKLAARRN